MNLFETIIEEANTAAELEAEALLEAGVIEEDQVEYSQELDVTMRFLEQEG